MDRSLWINRLALYLWLFSGPELRAREDELRARAQAMGQDVLVLLAGTPDQPDMPGLDDGRLAVAVCQGLFRNEAFEILYRRYAEYLVAFLIPHFRLDGHAASDLVHDLFLGLLAGDFDGYEAGRPFRPYFHRAAHNAAVTWLRHQARIVFVDLGDGPAGPGNPVLEEITEQEFEEEWAALLCRLPPEQRDVLERRVVYGQSYEQIMGELNVSYATVTGRLYRARTRLRELFRGRSPRATLVR